MDFISILTRPTHYRFSIARLLNPRAFLHHFSLCAPSAMHVPLTISVLYYFVFSVTECGMFWRLLSPALMKWNSCNFLQLPANACLSSSLSVTIPANYKTFKNYFKNSIQNVYINPFSTLTIRRLMSYIYMEHPFLMFLDHTQRHSTFGRTPLDEWSARRRDLYLTTHDTHNGQISMPPVGFEPTISAGERPWCF